MHITHVNLARGFAGGERQTALLIGRLSELGVAQCLVCKKKSPLRAFLKNTPGLSFHKANNMFSGHGFGLKKTDLFHAHEAKAAHWTFLETGIRKKPYIITRRVPNPLKRNRLTTTVYQRADAVVAISTKIEEILADYAPDLNLSVIPSAIGELPSRTEQVSRLRSRYGDDFVVGHIGTLRDRAKGQINLIEAAEILNSKYSGFHFVFLGKGEDERILKSRSEGVKNIEFAGFTEYPGDYLSVMDVFAFPSPDEGLGSSILDAMAYGVPVIASDVGGIPDIVEHEQNGLLIPPRNSRALADAISRLYENPGLRKQFSDKGRETAAAFSPEAMGERYLELYRQILKPKLSSGKR